MPTDQDTLSEIQYHLLENVDSGVTIASGLWTPAELLDALNEVQVQLLKDALLLMTPTTVAAIPHVLRHDLPTDWIASADVAYRTADAEWNELAKSDGFEADNSTIYDWPIEPGPPLLYTDGEVTTLCIQIMPASNDAGIMHILYVANPTTLTGAGISFTVPDEFVPAVKWGALAQLLGKVGRGADPERAEYCRLRYQEAVAAAAITLSGWA